jgi:acetyltransferase
MLDGLFYPRSVAIVGASNNPFSIGHIVIKNLAHYGFKGPIFPINPKASNIRSFKCFKSVLDVPDPIDLVNISIKATLIPQIVEECGQKGVKFLIVHSAGFKEVGEEGIKREREMVELAHKHGMRVFGPNSQGVQNADPEVSLYANFTFVPQKPGNVSIVAQGGGMGEMLKLHLHNVGLGHRMYASYGNECDLTMPELLEYYGQDEGTRVIMMQTESFKDPRAFLEVASKITPHKPILAIKAGRTREGSIAVSSHTGTLVDQAAMATAMYRKAGVVEFSDTHEMVKSAIAFSQQDPPSGKRIGIITNTGGPGIQAVDQAVTHGLTLAKWSDKGRERLKETQYPEASIGNPVDVVATGGPDQYHAAIETLLAEDGVDMVEVFFVTAPFVDLGAIAAKIKEVTATSPKPVVMVVETMDTWYGLIDSLREGGVPVYEFAEDGARALAAMAKYSELRDRKKEDPPKLKADKAKAEKIVKKYEGKETYLPPEGRPGQQRRRAGGGFKESRFPLRSQGRLRRRRPQVGRRRRGSQHRRREDPDGELQGDEGALQEARRIVRADGAENAGQGDHHRLDRIARSGQPRHVRPRRRLRRGHEGRHRRRRPAQQTGGGGDDAGDQGLSHTRGCQRRTAGRPRGHRGSSPAGLPAGGRLPADNGDGPQPDLRLPGG